MKIFLRADDTNSVHTRMSLFVDGKLVGQLRTSVCQANRLHSIFEFGKFDTDEFLSSGDFGDPFDHRCNDCDASGFENERSDRP